MKTAGAALRTGLALTVPGGLLVLAAILILQAPALSDSGAALLRAYPYLAFAVGVILSWRFGQSRLLLSVFALAVTERVLSLPGQAELHAVVAVLLPLNLAILSLLPERGLLTLRGFSRLAFFAGQAVAVLVLLDRQPGRLAALVGHRFLPGAYTDWTAQPQAAVLIFTAAAVVLAARFLYSRGALEAGFFWALLASFLAFHLGSGEGVASTYLATSQLVLCAAVIERSYTMAYRDDLTGLPGRRALNEDLDQLDGRYALAMVDVDQFKKLNDRYGHDVGDQVLRMIASRLSNVSGGGRAYRYGGEEFTVIFRRKRLEQALPHLDKLRESIASASFSLRSSQRPRQKPRKQPSGRSNGRADLKVTVSVGAAEPGGARRRSLEVIRAADKALYKAKRAGRNRVES